MILTSKESITIKEAIGHLLSARNEKEDIENLIAYEQGSTNPNKFEQVKRLVFGKALIIENNTVKPKQLAEWADKKGLHLPPELSELLPDYEAPEHEQAAYMPRLTETLRQLDMGNRKAKDGPEAKKIIVDQYGKCEGYSTNMDKQMKLVLRYIIEHT
jgi:hypothetical protein